MKVFIALFLLFLIEGTWASIFSWHYATPYLLLTLIGLMFVSLYGRWETALGFGLVFGLLYDIVYTDLLGIYVFTFSLIPLLAACPMAGTSGYEASARSVSAIGKKNVVSPSVKKAAPSDGWIRSIAASTIVPTDSWSTKRSSTSSNRSPSTSIARSMEGVRS
jgi:hypothetical protein